MYIRNKCIKWIPSKRFAFRVKMWYTYAMKCVECQKEITFNELGLSKKLINRGLQEGYCLPCLSKKFDVPEERLMEKIEEFKKAGCTLFI